LGNLPEQLETDAEMAAEVKVVQHVDDVVQAVLVPPPQVVQDADLHQSLVMESFLIPAWYRQKSNQIKT
jgi:hypothetical protein